MSITPFKISGLDDWSFRVSNATVDMSELSNAPGMSFPVGYNNPNLVNAQMWTGFYLQSLRVKLPGEISKTGRVTEVDINNMLIDNMGLTGLFKVTNVLNRNEGTMSGWDFRLMNWVLALPVIS